MGNGQYSERRLAQIAAKKTSSNFSNRFESPEYCDGINMYDDKKIRMNLNGDDGMIRAADFRERAMHMGYGPIGLDVADSAFNIYDRNRNGVLDRNGAIGASLYLDRLYR